MVFVGDKNPPPSDWPKGKNTTVANPISIREKPYLVCSDNAAYSVQVPKLMKRDSDGASWFGEKNLGSDTIPLSHFWVAKAGSFDATADKLNEALSKHYHLLLTPGVYHLDKPLVVNDSGTVILGLGMATLVPDYGQPAMIVADVDGVSITGVIFDAGTERSPSLLVVGYNAGLNDLPKPNHSGSPTLLADCCARVGGEGKRAAANCFTVNSNDVIMDNIWIWRADHGRMGTHNP